MNDSPIDPPRPFFQRFAPWLIVATLTVVLTATTISQSFERYRDFRSSWAWDQSWYNQWFWALTKGDGLITVRPRATFGSEKPSVWKNWYLTPAKFALAPIYRLFPDPRTLLVINYVVFWLIIPAAFGLIRGETKSIKLALSGIALIPLTPLVWPLAWNDFRELHLGLPFMIWGVQGVRDRNLRLSAIGIAGMLACRQEFAAIVASFVILPPKLPEDWRRSIRWGVSLMAIGVFWFFVVYLGYLVWAEGPEAPRLFLGQFFGPKTSLDQTLKTASEFIVIGLGALALLAIFAPRMAILILPWAWTISGGRWSLGHLSTVQWHEVRYTIPLVGMGLAAGLIGYARLGNRLFCYRRGVNVMVAVWIVAAIWGGIGIANLVSRIERVPHLLSRLEAREVWRWIDRVGPDDGVIADYVVTTPLSSRRRLYSYGFLENLPPGFPVLSPDIRWAFLGRDGLSPIYFLNQGFNVVYRGSGMTILRR